MKVAIVHDYLNQYGGAERVVLALSKIFPGAPIITSIYDKDATYDEFSSLDVRTSFMQKIPGVSKHFRRWFFLFPLAFESIDLKGYDLIISSSSAFAKGIKKPKGAKHVCYCHTPARFLWKTKEYELGIFAKILLGLFLPRLKIWDKKNTEQVDVLIANSGRTEKLIKKIYNRVAEVVYPPVDTTYFQPSVAEGGYFLVVGRLIAYKRYDVVVEAFKGLGLPLKIIGTGPALEELRKNSSSNIEFLERLDDRRLLEQMQGAKALIFPEASDLGLTPIEAASCGVPSIAFSGGGASETVVDGETGVLFNEQTVGSLLDAINKFNGVKFDKTLIRQKAIDKFDFEINFKSKILKFVC